MSLLDIKDKFRIEVETKQQELKILEKKKQKIMDNVLTDEDKKKLKESKEAYRRRWILELFKEFTNRDMTEEEYQHYISIIDDVDTKQGYSLISFIKKENPRAEPNPQDA
jgi:hypothetical protein